MPSFRVKDLTFTSRKKGCSAFTRSSFPQRFGEYIEIRTLDFEFQFNLRGEIKSIRGLGVHWPHPSEILIRTDGNDWVYHTVGAVIDYIGIKHVIGEYYLPCPTYRTNVIWEFNPYSDGRFAQAFAAWYQLFGTLYDLLQYQNIPNPVRELASLILSNDDGKLLQNSERLHSIINAEISVLPPDARHAGYEVIPLMVADGCRYHCGFCEVQSKRPFKVRAKESIEHQIEQLREFYGPDLSNYASLFLGNHDALGISSDLLLWVASHSCSELQLSSANGCRPYLFMFGSVDSFLEVEDQILEKLNQLPWLVFINIGFESFDEQTLAQLRKPTGSEKVKQAFHKMLSVNQEYDRIEVSANFLLGEGLPEEHFRKLVDVLGNLPDLTARKGTIYLSPLMKSRRDTELLSRFFDIKEKSRLPTFLYLIQRM